MRQFVFIFLSFILLSCRSYDVNRTLQDIDSYIMTRPDSALTVLEGVGRDLLRSERQRAYHALLYAMALDKNYIDVNDDSILVFEYFTASGVEDLSIVSEAVELIRSLASDLKDEDIYVLLAKQFENIFK